MALQAKPRKYKIKAGDKFGFLTVIQRVRDNVQTKSANLKIRFLCECVCGTRETIPQFYLIRENPKTHCGCKNKSVKTIHNEEYRIWLMMHVRTEDPRHVAYKHYGGRGIRVCEEWHRNRAEEGFMAFFNFVGPRPSPNHSIDRIDNDLGYQPYQADGVTRQIRWATAKEQRANQRPKS